ncbi:MAG: 50S ribosomal protein L5 [Synergistetes bacterium]|nr:50S ribosomal protein L5 [Synergistota bacterium]
MPRLKEKYKNEVIPKMMERFGYKNIMEVPRIDKIVINIGVGEAKDDTRYLDAAVEELAMITGQRPVVARAKRSIAGFKLREGAPIGCFVTLRGDRAYDFMDRLINIALPRIKDFRGLSPNSFDGRGNYTIGIREQLIFPEVDYDKVIKVRGMSITIVTTAETDDEARALLEFLGMPFRRR